MTRTLTTSLHFFAGGGHCVPVDANMQIRQDLIDQILVVAASGTVQ